MRRTSGSAAIGAVSTRSCPCCNCRPTLIATSASLSSLTGSIGEGAEDAAAIVDTCGKQGSCLAVCLAGDQPQPSLPQACSIRVPGPIAHALARARIAISSINPLLWPWSNGAGPVRQPGEGSVAGHAVVSVERGDLVGFGERRIVEGVLDEIVERAAEVEHGLADMDELGRAFADDMDAEQLAVF
jgi:hypothetical protein